MSRTASVQLDDGRELEYEVRPSARAKSLRLKMTVRDGLTVVVPKGVTESRVDEMVAEKSGWITQKLTQFDEVRDLLGHQPTGKPEAFELPALAESWRVEYVVGKATTVAAKTDSPGRLLVYGAVDDTQRCNAALRRWLSRRAKESMPDQLARLAAGFGFQYKRVAIKNQRTRWGSCSVTGTINLNCKLLFVVPPLVRYVLIHELCHTVEANHSSRFWNLLRSCDSNADALHEAMRQAWKQISPWASVEPKSRSLGNSR